MGQEFRWIVTVSERQDRQRIFPLTIIEVEIAIALEGPFGDSCRRNALRRHVQIFDPCDQTANAPSQWWGRRAVHHCTSHPNTSDQSLLRNRNHGVPMHSVTLKFEIKGMRARLTQMRPAFQLSGTAKDTEFDGGATQLESRDVQMLKHRREFER